MQVNTDENSQGYGWERDTDDRHEVKSTDSEAKDADNWLHRFWHKIEAQDMTHPTDTSLLSSC